MKRAILVVAALAAAGCGNLDSPDHVHDLRMLGMRAEPPEQVYAVPAGLDGGGLPLDAGLGGLGGLHLEPVTVRALVADPAGAGRAIHYQFAVCAALADGGRCDLTQPDAYAFKEADWVPDAGWAELSATFTPKLELLMAAAQQDPYHGFGFLPVPVQLTLTAGDEKVVGFKRVLFTVALPGQPVPSPNQNPFIPTVWLDGEPWSASTPPTLTDFRDYAVSPEVVDAGEEVYSKPTFEGGSIPFRESWRYNFFATAGGFTPSATGGQSSFLGSATPTSTRWTPDDNQPAGKVTYFVVVRDGRGGEGWTVREALFMPDAGP